MNTLCLLRKNLRFDDNKTLYEAYKNTDKQLIIAFIYDIEQLTPHPYFSYNGYDFMVECLDDMDLQLSTYGRYIFRGYGKPEEVCKRLCEKYDISSIYLPQDYTPYALERDKKLFHTLPQHIKINYIEEYLLHNPNKLSTKSGTPYIVYTPFKKQLSISYQHSTEVINIYSLAQKVMNIPSDSVLYKNISRATHRTQRGGESLVKEQLLHLSKHTKYNSNRDYPYLEDGTTKLSAAIKYGAISIRRLVDMIQNTEELKHTNLINELYWREFFYTISTSFPQVFNSKSFQHRYESVLWITPETLIDRWKNGTTGYPIVDAGMRQLLKTGYMHNRVRMITASFLTKNLGIHWRYGEQHFAQYLTDYDPSVNNGNWQWVAGTGADAAPYFRVFNPWLQQVKYDPYALYIKQYVDELASWDADTIHAIHTLPAHHIASKGYYPAIVDHKETALKAKERFQEAAIYYLKQHQQ